MLWKTHACINLTRYQSESKNFPELKNKLTHALWAHVSGFIGTDANDFVVVPGCCGFFVLGNV